jgi:septum formation protein
VDTVPIVDTVRFVLASASPARHRTLAAAGIDAEVRVSGVDESSVDLSDPRAGSLTLARLKAGAVAATCPDALVLGCDSVLAFDGGALGKPETADEAVRRWRMMRGRTGTLYTGQCLIDSRTDTSAAATAGTEVRFAQVTDDEIDAYVATGEPLRVAGAFTIDGIGGPFVESIDGDPGTVIGLSLPLLRRLLGELGMPITALWRHRLTSTL